VQRVLHRLVAADVGDQPVIPRKRALTIGAIAHELNEPIHRVQYAVRTRAIEPEAMAGHIRVFPPEAVGRIADILRDIDHPAARPEAVAR
jgi:hypothetical protein